MSEDTSWERVDVQEKSKDTEDDPRVSIVNDGKTLNILKHGRELLAHPNYICFFKTGTKVALEPHNNKEGLNPHKVSNVDNNQGIVSFSWHQCEETGTASLHYDDEQDWYWFDTEELSDE